MSWANKVALVTGGSKGIGKAIVQRLAAAGASVAVNYGSDAAAADELVASLGKDKAIAIQADAGSPKDLDRLVQETVAKFGKIDAVIPNAAALNMKDLASTSEEDFDKTYALNVKGPYFLIQKAVPHMPEGGRVVLVSTSLCAASTVTPNYLLYVSSKGAIEQMTRVLAKDLAKKGINVNAVAPGPTATDLFMKDKPEAVIKTIASFSPYNRLGTPEDIAGAVEFLCAEGSRWVTGQILRVNGGFV